MNADFWLGIITSLVAIGLSCGGVKSLKDGHYYWSAMFFTHALTMAVGVGVGIGMDLSRP